MTRHVISHKDGRLDSDQSEILALYREGDERAEPAQSLDRVILDAARADLEIDGFAKPERPTPWWKRWLPATSAIAVAILGVSVSLHVMEQAEIDRAAPFGAESARQTDSKPVSHAPEPATGLSDSSKTDQNKPAVTPPQVTGPKPKTDRAEARQVPSAMAPPSPAVELHKERRQFGAHEPQEAGEKDVAGSAASTLAMPSGKLEAKRRDAESASAKATGPGAAALSRPTDEAATPEAWLQRIRELRAAGRYTEAELSLGRFRTRYPDFVVPADLNPPR